MQGQVSPVARLIDDLLDVTRIGQGKIRLQRERVKLNDLVPHAAEDHRASFEQCGIAFEALPADSELFVDADRTRIAQVLGNLLQNAAKLTPPGGSAKLSLTADPIGSEAILRVRDSGPGIAPELLPHLFQPFVHSNETTQTKLPLPRWGVWRSRPPPLRPSLPPTAASDADWLLSACYNSVNGAIVTHFMRCSARLPMPNAERDFSGGR